MISHQPEFQADDKRKAEAKSATASVYQECFSTEAGRIVLEDLHLKFGLGRARFDIRDGDPSPIKAAMIEGQCSVMREIERALEFKPTT